MSQEVHDVASRVRGWKMALDSEVGLWAVQAPGARQDLVTLLGECDRLLTIRLRLEGENEALRAERDALLGLLVQESAIHPGHYLIANAIPDGLRGYMPSREAAIRTVLVRAGLPAVQPVPDSGSEADRTREGRPERASGAP
jgi:hypothetical protein